MKGYVFVNVAPGRSLDVVAQLRSIEGVESRDTCCGLPDIIARVEAADLKGLQDFLLNKILKVAGANQTDTHIVWEA